MNSSNQNDIFRELPSLEFFTDFSQKIINSESERNKGLVFIHFDVKNFRMFNYLFGFDESDRLLVHVGNVIDKNFPEFCVSRCFNDRFIALAYNSDIEKRVQLVEESVATFKRKKDIAIKAGVYVVPKKFGASSTHAQECAKIACESVIDSAKIHVAYYDNELGRREELRKHIIESIDGAVADDFVKVYYQPIVHVVSGKICAYEGLARWEDPEFGFLSPADFIGVLENARLIHKLDLLILKKICSDMKSAMQRGWTIVPVSINLSALDFKVLNMPYITSAALKINGLPKNLLNIEITERALGENRQEIYGVFEKFRSNGFEIWLDNFGSKYSSLNVLEEIKFDLLKIDRQFLKNFHTKERSRSILKNIIHMAKELGIRTLMEGVEDASVLEFLKQSGCENAQGFFFGRPAPVESINDLRTIHENAEERLYYNAIGRVNLLSQTPLETGWSSRENSMLNGLPLAITEFNGQRFKFLMSNAAFKNIFKDLGIGPYCSPDDVFNDFSLQFARKIQTTAQKSIETGNSYHNDFVTSEGFFCIRLRCIAYNRQTKIGALLAIVDYISNNSFLRREERQSAVLKFLYTFYNRIDLIKQDGTEVENIYISSTNPDENFERHSVKLYVENFAQKNIHIEDRLKFEKFFDLETIDERVKEAGGTHITDYFRTRNEWDNFSWQMFMLLPVIHYGEKYFLCCARNIDAERLKRLPEIDSKGMEYYDMPGNPIFLLLASRSFTSILGYGSFEKFLRNSFYLEANLTTNRILYMHLGKEGMSTSRAETYMSMSYDDATQYLILKNIDDEYKKTAENFLNREKLLNNYAQGKISSETEILRTADDVSQYFYAAHQLRESNEVNEIHMFLLAFDIDAYRRKNEQIKNLIERDALTGLFNRRIAIEMLQKLLAEKNIFAFIILDLDNFKQINDRFGHDCGDKIIKNAALMMNKFFGDNGIIARIGGDEFLVILNNLSPNIIEERLKNFSTTKKFIVYKNQQVNYTMSIGCSIFPKHGENYRELYQNADMALYAVKMAGRNGYKKFSPEMTMINRTQMGVTLTQISEGMPGGFLLYRDNATQEILYANTRLWKIYECESLEQFRKFTGNSFRGCVHPDDWDKVQKTIYEQVKISESYDYVRYRVKTAKGNIKIIEDFGRLVYSPNDGNVFYVFIIDFEAKEKLWDFVMNPAEKELN